MRHVEIQTLHAVCCHTSCLTLFHWYTIYFHFIGATAYSYAYFGRGTGGIYLDNLGCRGNEMRLIDCYHNPLGVHNCGHNADAGMRCRRKAPFTFQWYRFSIMFIAPTNSSRDQLQKWTNSAVWRIDQQRGESGDMCGWNLGHCL